MSISIHTTFAAVITAAVITLSAPVMATTAPGGYVEMGITVVKHGIEEGDCTGHHRKEGVECEDRLEHHR